MGLLRAKSELMSAVLETKEFFDLKNAKNLLSSEHRKQVAEFQKKAESLNSPRQNQEEAAKISDWLNEEYARFSKIPEVNKYLKAANAMNILLDKIFVDINESINANLL